VQQAQEQVRLAEVERFQQMTIEGAQRVIQLKKEIETLKRSAPEPDDANDRRRVDG
jgi:hypothetical protein